MRLLNVVAWCLLGFAVGVNGVTSEDYYRILGVQRSASAAAIKKAYRALTKKYHPDVNPSKDAADNFAAIAEAYGVLSDEKKRSAYDRHGKKGVKAMEEGDSHHGSPFDSMFSHLFGGGFHPFGHPAGGRGREKSEDINMRLYITLEQMYAGDILHVAYKRKELCLHADDCVMQRQECVAENVALRTQQIR